MKIFAGRNDAAQALKNNLEQKQTARKQQRSVGARTCKHLVVRPRNSNADPRTRENDKELQPLGKGTALYITHTQFLSHEQLNVQIVKNIN